ncbi:hypothetical protein [Eubacterium sp.]|uniref:hypothetical protein n=1 Tax=Eubacterium sp. TaxID=142586 RepID=UPI002FC98958
MKLSELSGGALQEVFNYELAKVLANIRDINTDAKAKRKITIELTIASNEKRTIGDIDFKVKHTSAPINGFTTSIAIGEERGTIVAEEIGMNEIPGQISADNVIEMQREAK